jgi:hypothetical protein
LNPRRPAFSGLDSLGLSPFSIDRKARIVLRRSEGIISQQFMLQTEELIQAAHRKASSELKNWSGTTGNFFQLTFFGDEGFRGVVILRAPSLESALSLSYLLKLNPGGSVASAQLPSGLHEELLISHSKRLLNQREADDLQAKLVTSAQVSSKFKA